VKKLVTTLLTVSLISVLSLPANAIPVNPFSPDLATIQGMTKTWDGSLGDGTTSWGLTKTLVGSAVRFVSSMQYGDGTGVGYASMGVGYGWPPPAGLGNLSGYDGYSLMFLNTNNSSWFVNVYMNTGWTDSPYNETNNFYESTWVELLPNVATMVTLDFAGAINLNHVTNIGFQVGGNMTTPYNPLTPQNPSNPDSYHIDVSQIPEPATMMLLGFGALGLLKRRQN
jgi:hypothetical protein